MRRQIRSRKKIKGVEDISGEAAWLYTDLLLGLAVAFVGAGAFMATNPNYVEPAKGEVILTYQLSCDALELTADQSTSDGELQTKLITAIKVRGDRKGWTEVKPGVINLFGGGSNNSIGTANAKRFNDRVASKTPALDNTEILPYADNNLSPSQVKLRIYLVYKGDENDNGCK
jgi:hypothetical protein